MHRADEANAGNGSASNSGALALRTTDEARTQRMRLVAAACLWVWTVTWGPLASSGPSARRFVSLARSFAPAAAAGSAGVARDLYEPVADAAPLLDRMLREEAAFNRTLLDAAAAKIGAAVGGNGGAKEQALGALLRSARSTASNAGSNAAWRPKWDIAAFVADCTGPMAPGASALSQSALGGFGGDNSGSGLVGASSRLPPLPFLRLVLWAQQASALSGLLPTPATLRRSFAAAARWLCDAVLCHLHSVVQYRSLQADGADNSADAEAVDMSDAAFDAYMAVLQTWADDWTDLLASNAAFASPTAAAEVLDVLSVARGIADDLQTHQGRDTLRQHSTLLQGTRAALVEACFRRLALFLENRERSKAGKEVAAAGEALLSAFSPAPAKDGKVAHAPMQAGGGKGKGKATKSAAKEKPLAESALKAVLQEAFGADAASGVDEDARFFPLDDIDLPQAAPPRLPELPTPAATLAGLGSGLLQLALHSEASGAMRGLSMDLTPTHIRSDALQTYMLAGVAHTAAALPAPAAAVRAPAAKHPQALVATLPARLESAAGSPKASATPAAAPAAAVSQGRSDVGAAAAAAALTSVPLPLPPAGTERKGRAPPLPRPNFFLSLRLLDRRLASQCEAVQAAMIEQCPDMQPALVPAASDLHITLGLLVLRGQEGITRARGVLESCTALVGRFFASTAVIGTGALPDELPVVPLAGIGHFSRRVIFACPSESAPAFVQLKALCAEMHVAFTQAGLTVEVHALQSKRGATAPAGPDAADAFDEDLVRSRFLAEFKPHATLFKLTKVKRTRGDGKRRRGGRVDKDGSAAAGEDEDEDHSDEEDEAEAEAEATQKGRAPKPSDADAKSTVQRTPKKPRTNGTSGDGGAGTTLTPAAERAPQQTPAPAAAASAVSGAGLKQFPDSVLNLYPPTHALGASPILRVELSEMTRRDPETRGYYKCHATLEIVKGANDWIAASFAAAPASSTAEAAATQ
jgi:hypothetical protein